MPEDLNKLTLNDFRKDPELMFSFLDFFLGFKPYNYQKKFLLACLKTNRIVGKWCRQSGKSTTVAAYCAFRCLIQPTTIIITAPTLTHSSELYSKIRTFMTSKEFIKQKITRLTQTELTINNNSRIKALPSGVEGKSIRGFTADVTIEEEAGLINDEINNKIIMPLIASKKDEGQVIKIGTPETKNHFYRSCFIDPTFSVINITWRDCVSEGQYTQAFVDEQKRNITDVEFETEYEANFIEVLSSFFPLPLVQSSMVNYKLMETL